jgi:hypothetical protein
MPCGNEGLVKYVTLIIAALFAAPLWAVVPMPVPEVEPLRRVSVEGFISVDSGWAWNGEQFRVNVLAEPEENIYGEALARLVFATDRTYREAVRNDGFIVRVEGVEVRRGSERLLVVDSIRTLTK